VNFKLLENIISPSDIKNMSIEELNLLAAEIREALILNVSTTGGHLASNLGIVELTIALHRVFDSPDDKIVFDVGHQSYVHKMLTGRFKEFSTLRQKNGLSGFPNPEESGHDIFKTGHSSTSISSALGLACAMSLNGNDCTSVAVIGDGSMTGGLAYEGLNNADNSKKNIIVVLNDNNMSISPNVGAIAKSLTYMRNKRSYFRFKDAVGNLIIKTPFFGRGLYRRLVKVKSAVKSYFYSSNIFEGMGFKYIGPVDGHDIELLSRVLSRAKSLKCPVLVHVKTKKGKGYSFAENSPYEFHGVGEFNVVTGSADTVKKTTYTDKFGETIVDIAKNNSSVCAITAAMGPNCGLSEFRKQFPDRYFDVGIAESHAVTFAAGLAKMEKIPVFVVYSTFLQRSYDQIIHDVSLQKLKVVFAIDRAGITGEDGETHQGLFDIPMLLPVPNINIFCPTTAGELDLFLRRAINDECFSSFVRYPKANCISLNGYPFEDTDRDWTFFEKSSSVAVVSYGRQMLEVVNATENIKVDLFKLNLINRFDGEFVTKLKNYKSIIFVEECYKNGSVGSMLECCLISNGFNGRFIHKAIDNTFIKHSTQNEAKELCGIDALSIKNIIKDEMQLCD